jgi:hypothetical protein
MDQFNINHAFVAGDCSPASPDHVKEQARSINREATRRHLRHLAGWSMRAVLLGLVFAAGELLVSGGLGEVIKWAAVAVAPFVLMFTIKGHRAIRTVRLGRLYWLRQDSAEAAVVNEKAERKEKRSEPLLIVASAPHQDDRHDDVSWMKKQALS